MPSGASPKKTRSGGFVGVHEGQHGLAGGRPGRPAWRRRARALRGRLPDSVVGRQRRRVPGRRAGPVGGVAGRLDQRDLDAEPGHLLSQAWLSPPAPTWRRGRRRCSGTPRSRRSRRPAGCARCPARAGSGSAAWVTHSAPKRLVSSCAADLGLADLLDHAELPVAGVVHHDVQPPEVLVRLLHRGEIGVAVGDVQPDRQDRVAVLARRDRRGCAMSRAVAATVSPRSSAAIAHSRPKPRDVPVMNQVFTAMKSPSGRQGFSQAASRRAIRLLLTIAHRPGPVCPAGGQSQYRLAGTRAGRPVTGG